MFDFLFGGKRKLELIRELLEQRMREAGFDDMQSRLKVKELGNLQLIGTPEGSIVTIVETVFKLQKRGMLLWQVLDSIENHRKSLGHDLSQFVEISHLARQTISKATSAVPLYAFYRVNIEYPGLMTKEQFENAFVQAAQSLSE